MAELTNQQLVSQLKSLLGKVEGMELERVNELGPGGQAAFCCGCICISKCVANSPAGMRDLRILVEKGELELPVNLHKLLSVEINN